MLSGSRDAGRPDGGVFVSDYDCSLLQNHLVEWIVEFEGYFECRGSYARHHSNGSSDVSELLIQKIVGFRHLDVFEMDLLGIGLLGGHRKAISPRRRAAWMRTARQQNQATQK